MKKVLAVFLAIAMVSCFMPAMAFADETAPAISVGEVQGTIIVGDAYEIDENGKLTEEFKPNAHAYVEVTLTGGSGTYTNVRTTVSEVSDGLQLIAQDSNHNWYDIVKAGWGAPEGFTLPANHTATTTVYIVATKSGDYSANINLVDVSGSSDTTIATASSKVTAFDDLSIEVGSLPENLVISDLPVETNEHGLAESFNPDGHSPVAVKLYNRTGNNSGYFRVKVDAPTGVQLMAYDTTSGKWYDIVKAGWGPGNGFQTTDSSYQSGVATQVYPVITTLTDLGDITIKLVEISGGTEAEPPAATATVQIPTVLGAATIGTTQYATLADAVTAAASGAVIVLNKDNSEDITVAKSLTVNKNGHNCTGLKAGSGYTMTEANDTITFASETSTGGGGSYVPPADPLAKERAEANSALAAYVNMDDYETADQTQIEKILADAKTEIAAAKTAAEIDSAVAKAESAIDEIATAAEKAEILAVQNAKIVTKSQHSKLNGKRAVKVSWTVPKGMDFDGYEVYRSTMRFKGFGTEPFFTTVNKTYKNNKSLKKGNTYYYKVRGYKVINGEKVYTPWSTKAWRTIK